MSAGLMLLAGAALAQPGRLPATKKLIEYGWGVPSPVLVRDHIRQMEERPFDGVIMRLAGKGGGRIFSGGRWDPAEYQADLEALRGIKWEKFRHNFIMIYAASEQDWFSDSDWEGVLGNLAIMAQAAKAGGCYLAFDPEPYGKNPWNYPTQPRAGQKSFAEYQAKVRERGQQFIEAIGRYLPDNVLLTLFSYSNFAGQTEIADPLQREQALAQHPYGLYLSFLNGMLDRLGPQMTITDGNEPSYYYENAEKFYEAHHLMRQRALALVPPESVHKHQTQVQVSQALYMDYVFARMSSKAILFILNPKNVQWDAEFTTDNDLNFNPNWVSATNISAGVWTAEIAIPWAELKIEPRPGLQLRADLCRQRRPEWELSCWSQLVRGFLEPGNFGLWTLK